MKSEKNKVAIIILSIISVLLIVALTITVILFYQYKNKMTVEAMATRQKAEKQVETIKAESVPLEVFKEYSEQYGVSTEFIQRFFDDVIVYRNGAEMVYEPIDETLAKNDLDFSNIKRVDGELEYHENGVSTGIKGIDVSKHQGDIDWKKVKADGVEFAMIRLGFRGYGTGAILLDEYFEKNINAANEAGVKVGVYFFSQAINEQEAIEEAKYVLEHIKDYKVDYPVVYDAEEIFDSTPENVRTKDLTKQQRTDITKAFCEEVKAGGYTPMIYGNVKWMCAQIDMSQLTEYDKWFAQYFRTPFFPYELSMWQYTAKGKVDGIKGDVDMNIGFKDYAK